jgi:hypothetical protein
VLRRAGPRVDVLLRQCFGGGSDRVESQWDVFEFEEPSPRIFGSKAPTTGKGAAEHFAEVRSDGRCEQVNQMRSSVIAGRRCYATALFLYDIPNKIVQNA